jgi:hypothetical protein
MNRILRAAFVGFAALVTTAACGGRADDGAPRGVASGDANEGGVALGGGAPPSAGASALDGGAPPSGGGSWLGCPAAGDAAATGALAGNFIALSVGNDFACALTASGAVQCWGNGQVASSAYPVTVIDSGATAISAADLYACAVTYGAVQCWDYSTSSTPQATVGPCGLRAHRSWPG